MVKDLGVVYDCKLIFGEHINHFQKNLWNAGFYNNSNKILYKLPVGTNSLQAYANNVLSFGSVIWNSCTIQKSPGGNMDHLMFGDALNK